MTHPQIEGAGSSRPRQNSSHRPVDDMVKPIDLPEELIPFKDSPSNPMGLAEQVSQAADMVEQEYRQAENRLANHLDPKTRRFTCSNGNVVQISDKPITSLMVERIQAVGRPEIPMIEVKIGGKHTSVEYHPNDEGYQLALETWQAESEIRVMRYLFVRGVEGNPPEDFIREMLPWMPDADLADMKYMWVASLIPNEDIEVFVEALVGQFSPTQEGVAQAAASFQRPGRRQPD